MHTKTNFTIRHDTENEETLVLDSHNEEVARFSGYDDVSNTAFAAFLSGCVGLSHCHIWHDHSAQYWILEGEPTDIVREAVQQFRAGSSTFNNSTQPRP